MNYISSQLTIGRTYYKVFKYRHKTGFQATKFLKFRNTCFQVEDDISADTLSEYEGVIYMRDRVVVPEELRVRTLDGDLSKDYIVL